MSNISQTSAALGPARQPGTPAGRFAATQQLVLLVTATQCIILGCSYSTLARDACTNERGTTLPDTILLRGFPCAGSRAEQAGYVLLRLPYAFGDLLNYSPPEQWANHINTLYLIRLPLLLLLPYGLYEVLGTAIMYAFRLWPFLVYLARGPEHRPGTTMLWLLIHMPLLEVALCYPATPAPLPLLQGAYGVVSTACTAVLSYWYAERYPGLKLWPPLMILRQALATCITTYMAVRWSRDRYGTWYGRPHGRSAAGTTSLQANGTAVPGQTATSVDSYSLDGIERRSRAREAAKLGQVHVPASPLQQGHRSMHAGSSPSDGVCGAGDAAARTSAVPRAFMPPLNTLATSPEAVGRQVQPMPPPPNSPAATTCQPPTAPATTTGNAGNDAGTAGTHDAAAPKRLPRYRGMVSVRTVTYKIPGYHPGDIPPGYVQRLADTLMQQQQQQQQLSAGTVGGTEGGAAEPAAAAVTPRPAASGGPCVRLKAAYIREGCIELVMYLAERVEGGGGIDGGDAAAAGAQEQGSPEAGEQPCRKGADGGTAVGERGSGEVGVRCWQLDRGSGVCRRVQACEGGTAWSVRNVLGALQLPQRAMPPESSGTEAGGQQGRALQGSGVDLGAGAGEGQELAAVEVSPRVVLIGAAAGAGGSAQAADAPVHLQLTVTHSAAGSVGGLAAANAGTQLEAHLVLLQQLQQQQQQQAGEMLEGRRCRLVPCRMTVRTEGPADALYGSGGGTIRTVYDVEADLGGMACGPGPAELHVRVGGLPAGGVLLLFTAQPAVAGEVGAAAAAAMAQEQHQPHQQQIDEQPLEGAGGQLGALLWDLGTWEACIAALPAAATAGTSKRAGPLVPNEHGAAALGRHLLQYAEACGWEGTATWIREELGRLLGQQGTEKEQGRGGGVQGQQGDTHGYDGGECSGNGAQAGVQDPGCGSEAGVREQEATREEGPARWSGGLGMLQQAWLGVEPAGRLEQSFQVFETLCLLLIPLGDPGGGYRMHVNSLIYFGLGALVLLSRAFLTHGSWARLVASYRLPRYLSYIAAKLATALYGLSVPRLDMLGGPVQLVYDGILLPLCCPLPATLAVPLLMCNAAALSAAVWSVQLQQHQQQLASSQCYAPQGSADGLPLQMLTSSASAVAAALVGLRVAGVALLSMAFMGSWRRNSKHRTRRTTADGGVRACVQSSTGGPGGGSGGVPLVGEAARARAGTEAAACDEVKGL